MTDTFTVVGLIALVGIVVDFIKPWIPSSVPTIPVAWAVGVGLLFLASSASAFSDQQLAGHLINNLDWQSKVFGGVSIGSSAAFAVKVIKGVDNSQSAAVAKGTALEDSP